MSLPDVTARYATHKLDQTGSSVRDEYFSRVGEFRSIRRELRTLNVYQGRTEAQGSGPPGYLDATQLRDAADRLAQKKEEMDLLESRCRKLGIYEDLSDSDESDYIDSLSEPGEKRGSVNSFAVPASQMSPTVSVFNDEYSDSHERDGFISKRDELDGHLGTLDMDMNTKPYPEHISPPNLPAYNRILGWNIPRESITFGDLDYGQEQLKPYRHTKLPSEGSHIRLLKLVPCDRMRQDSVWGEIILRDLNDEKHLSYEALSWCWESATWDASIQIRFADESYRFNVSRNLFSALQALRPERSERFLWIDAICINQADPEEKSRQVVKMGDIYSMATNVCVWLGEADIDSAVAIDFIKRNTVKLHNFDELCNNQDAASGCRAMINLMQRPWFTRRWVIQEIALSNGAVLYCDTKTVTWTEFADAVSLIAEVESATHRLSDVMGRDGNVCNLSFQGVSTLGAALLVDITNNLFRKSLGKREPLLSLEYLVSQLSTFEVSEPRDAIYSLLSMARDVDPAVVSDKRFSGVAVISDRPQINALAYRCLEAKSFHVDYSLPFAELCKDFVLFSIAQSAAADPSCALDIICRHWAPSPWKTGLVIHGGPDSVPVSDRQRLPSWVPEWTGAAFSSFSQVNSKLRLGRRNGDSLVGLPGTRPRNYSASGNRGVEFEYLRFRKYDTSYSMSASGFVLDVIHRVEVASQGGHIPEEWIEAAGWRSFSNNPPEEFWRTLVADRGPNGRNPPLHYSRALKESITKGLAGGSLDTTKLINEGRVSIVSGFFRRVQSVIWNRSLMRTESRRLGVVGKRALQGDLICILYGCSVPVVLRRHIKSDDMIAKDTRKADKRVAEREDAAAIRIQRAFRRRHKNCLAVPSTDRVVEIRKGTAKGESRGHLTPSTMSTGRHRNTQYKIPLSPASRSVLMRQDDHHWYELIGECYIHGMMDGEAIQYQTKHGIKPQVFDLR